MRKQFLSAILLFLAICLQTSCVATNFNPTTALKQMKAKDYFDGDLEIRLADAAARGDHRRMRELLNQGANVNALGRQGMRPLFWALCKQNIKGFKFLLENGADPNVRALASPQDSTPASAVELAAIMEESEYLRLLLKHGGNPNETAGPAKETAIYEAIMHHRIENVRVLINAGANINHQDFSGITPMMKAAEINQYEIVYLLLQSGADPTKKDRWGYNLAGIIQRFGDRGMKKGSEQHQWYLKVVEELKRRELIE